MAGGPSPPKHGYTQRIGWHISMAGGPSRPKHGYTQRIGWHISMAGDRLGPSMGIPSALVGIYPWLGTVSAHPWVYPAHWLAYIHGWGPSRPKHGYTQRIGWHISMAGGPSRPKH